MQTDCKSSPLTKQLQFEGIERRALAQPALQAWIGIEKGFKDDTLRYSLYGFELEPISR